MGRREHYDLVRGGRCQHQLALALGALGRSSATTGLPLLSIPTAVTSQVIQLHSSYCLEHRFFPFLDGKIAAVEQNKPPSILASTNE